tara:strand:- start:80 stop:328 length:249 start_codon:yes stop_codon:yes gene_type:complete
MSKTKPQLQMDRQPGAESKPLKMGAILDNYREELEAMSNHKLEEEIEWCFGIEADDIEDERQQYIDDLVDEYKTSLTSRGEK